MARRLGMLYSSVFAMLLISGCGSGRYEFETVPVEGLVVLNGEPLPDALVTFQPEKGRPAYGRTDESGRYELLYMEGKPGALPGKHKVSITTALEPDSDSVDRTKQKGRPESVPFIYNRQTQLEVMVSLDQSEPVDFELKGTVKKNRLQRN